MVPFLAAATLILACSPPAVMLLRRSLQRQKISALLRIQNPHGIDEERYVEIGGIDQWIGIRGEDRGNPILLIVHGGPGASCSIFSPRIREWERHFTIAQWDQRGSGKTLSRTGAAGVGNLTFEQLIQDGIEVAEFVCQHLDQPNVVLMGCSQGSTFSLSMAARQPDLFSAYVGTDQNVSFGFADPSDREATIERLRAAGRPKDANKLAAIDIDPRTWTAGTYLSAAKLAMRSDPAMYKRIMALLKDSLWNSPRHSLSDLRTFVRGMHLSLQRLYPDIAAFRASEHTHFDIPFFVFQGDRDVVTSTAAAKTFFETVQAPVKAIALIRDAGHFAAFLQPDQFLRELLTHVRPVVLQAETRTTSAAD